MANLSERQKKLIDKIEKAKNELILLQEKRKQEIGELAFKYKIENVDNALLEKMFSELAKEFSHVNA